MEASVARPNLPFSIENILRGTTHTSPKTGESTVNRNSPSFPTYGGDAPSVQHPFGGVTPSVSPIYYTQEGRVSPTHSDSPSPVPSESDSSIVSEPSMDENEDPSPNRTKKLRTTFTAEQVKELEDLYTRRRYLPASDRRKVAAKLKLADQQVKTWFQNRRMKEKRVVRESDKLCPLPLLPNLHVPVHPSPLALLNQDAPRSTSCSLPQPFPAPQRHLPVTPVSLVHPSAMATQVMTSAAAVPAQLPSWNILSTSDNACAKTVLLNSLPVGSQCASVTDTRVTSMNIPRVSAQATGVAHSHHNGLLRPVQPSNRGLVYL